VGSETGWSGATMRVAAASVVTSADVEHPTRPAAATIAAAPRAARRSGRWRVGRWRFDVAVMSLPFP
jgi:hypothetical protein